MSDALTAAASGPGRTRITSRALNRVVSQVTSEELGVEPRKVGVELDDDGGALTLTVKAPMHVVSLRKAMDDPGAVTRSGGSLMDRAGRAQENIHDRIRSMTGSDISRIFLRLTTADITEEKRVK